MSANVHALLHLPDVVQDLGPLWAHSCFLFESANGKLLNLLHGSQGIEKQVFYFLDDNNYKINFYGFYVFPLLHSLGYTCK